MFNKVLIHKDNLINNIKQVKSENPNSKICAMVKANAYGVGLAEVVQILDPFVDFWGVACFFEAQKIKKFSNKNILVCGAIEHNAELGDFSYSCGSLEDVNFLISLNKPIKIHLKINSGMNRFGFKGFKEFKKALSLIVNSKLIVEGIYTHFATTDEFVAEQMKEFKKFVDYCKKIKITPIVHTDNSCVNETNNHGLDMVRIGFNLYNKDSGWFLPVVKIKSKIVHVCEVRKGELIGYGYRCVAKRNMTVAVVPIGYADGFTTKYIGLNLSVHGYSCKVLNVCMDCFMLDISKTTLKKGDELFILNKLNPLKKYSEYAEISEYEVMTQFSKIRAERIVI